MKIYISLFIFSLFINTSDCDKIISRKPVRCINISCVSDKQELLKMKFSYDKSIPKECELQALTALSYYPELHNTSIEFQYSDISTTMATRPKTLSAIKNSNRVYVIFIDTIVENNNGILFKDVPFNAQIGLIGHELAHILTYQEQNSKELISFGMNYMSNHKAEIEKETDKTTIKKGLGWQLFDWSDFVLNKSTANESYKTFKKINYLTPNEIKVEIKNQVQY